MPNIRQSASWAISKCEDDNVGYSMATDRRNQVTVNGITYYDCSSFINYALLAGGFSTPSYAPNHNAFTTATMRNVLLSLGFKKLSVNTTWKRGDILWRTRHTEMAYSATQAMGARGQYMIVDGHTVPRPLPEQVAIHDSSASDWMELYRYEQSTASDWYYKTLHGYDKDSTEALSNCELIYGILSDYGWTLNAVCGVLGNIGAESQYNPWRWQHDKVLEKGSSLMESTEHGYGLFQFTPPKKYALNATAQSFAGFGVNYSNEEGSPNDGNAQLKFMNENVDGGYFLKEHATYPLTFAQYKRSTQTPEYLAKAWLHNYERPADPSATENARASLARYWYNKLSGVTPPTPPTPTGYTVTVNLLGGNGWVTPTASPNSGLSEGDRVDLGYTSVDPHNGLDEPEFIRWRVDYGDIEIQELSYFDMPDSNVVITAIFTGKTIDPSGPSKYNKFESWYLKPWYIQNRGE